MPSTATDRLNGLTTSVAVKAPCRVATTAGITLSGEQTIDGIAVVSGDRVLVMAQADPVENGIYNASASAWTRAADFNGSLDAVGGTQVSVIRGTAYANSYWRVDGTSTSLVIGIDDIEFEPGGLSDSATQMFLQAGVDALFRTVQSKLRETVSVTDFEDGEADGTSDNTAAFQAAQDALADGGTILVPRSANAYRVSRVDITNPNIRFVLESGVTIKKYGSGGTAGADAFGYRGMFTILNFLNANFAIEGAGISSVLDLNGEGPTGVGVAGRIANTYGDLNVAGTKGITSAGNSAIFALRSTHISVHRLYIKNTSESGVLYRNCSDTSTTWSHFENIAHYGVEISTPAAVSDQGTGTMPDLSRHRVNFCTFTDHQDFGLGTGDGVGIGGGGVAATNPRDFEFIGNVMHRCQRAVNLEIPSGSTYYEGGQIECRAYDMLQGGVGLVNARGFDIDFFGRDIGAGPTGALYTGVFDYGDIYGVVIAGPNSDGNEVHVDIEDDRGIKIYRATDGAITSGSTTLTSPSSTFTTNHVGLWVGVMGAGPSGTCLHARIVSRLSATSVQLEFAASITVTGATFGWGGATRYGVLINAGGDVKVMGRIKAGILSGLSSEPPAAGIYIKPSVTGRVDTAGLLITAPTTAGTTPSGILLTGALSGRLRLGDARAGGFTANFAGTGTYNATVETNTIIWKSATASPLTTADTYGATISPTIRENGIAAIAQLTLTTANVSAETVTALVTVNYDDAASDTFTKTFTTNTTYELTVAELASIQRDNRPIRSVTVQAKSSIGGSTSRTVTPTMIAVGC